MYVRGVILYDDLRETKTIFSCDFTKNECYLFFFLLCQIN